FRAGEPHRCHRHRVATRHEVVLEGDLLARRAAGPGKGEHRAHRVVGDGYHRQVEAPGPGDLTCDRRESGTLTGSLGAVEVGAQVAVTQTEPGGPAVAFEGRHGLPGLVAKTPAPLGVDGAGDRVHDRVEVGA